MINLTWALCYLALGSVGVVRRPIATYDICSNGGSLNKTGTKPKLRRVLDAESGQPSYSKHHSILSSTYLMKDNVGKAPLCGATVG